MNQVTAVVADDSVLIREALAGLLSRQGIQIVGQVSRADDLVALLEQMANDDQVPDLVIVDVRMPPTMTTDGLQAAITLKERHPRLSVLVLSQYVAAAYAQQLFCLPSPPGSGGTGYLLKERIAEVADFLHAVETVASGGMVIDPEVSVAMLHANRSGLGELTAREHEVLAKMALGLSNTQIAEELVISQAAVAKHVSNIFAKLHLQPDEENRRVRAILAYLSSTGHHLQ